MESFGKAPFTYESSKKWVVVCCVMVILLHQGQGLSVVPRVYRISRVSRSNVRLQVSNDYFAFLEEELRIYCYCRNESNAQVRTLSLRLRDRQVSSTNGCSQTSHQLYASHSNTGPYQCVVESNNGSIHRTEAGNLSIIDPGIIQVPDVQYGLLHSNTTLTCIVNTTESSSSITWKTPNSSALVGGRIVSANHEHEGRYMCEVYLSTFDLRIKKPVQFTVIVPPTIVNQSSSEHLVRNEAKNLFVQFHSKNSEDTSVSWYRDGRSLQNANTVPLDLDAGNWLTQMTFNPIRRSVRGNYLVVIENAHSIIPSNQRRVEVRFTIMVSILPAEPMRLNVNGISDQSATLSWSLVYNHTDASADNQTVAVYYWNGTVAYHRVVEGEARETQLSLIPGERYYARVTAQNQDGITASQNHSFQTLSGAPSVSAAEVERTDHNSTLSLRVSLNYTGGGAIHHFVVAFRHYPEGGAWIALGNITASTTDSMLVWTAQVADDRFQGSRIELRLEAVNSNGHTSNQIMPLEEIDIDECAHDNGGCTQSCTNIIGSFQCSCFTGYVLAADSLDCDDVNECLAESGGCAQICNNTLGSFECSCDIGYTLAVDNFDCNDDNECQTNNGDCAQTCNNTYGSFECSCDTGYNLAVDNTSCDDVNECETNNGDCEHICTNADGSYQCLCVAGYSLAADNLGCVDINECLTNNGGCAQICDNTDGSFTCSCGIGYTLAVDNLGCEVRAGIDQAAVVAGGVSASVVILALTAVLVLATVLGYFVFKQKSKSMEQCKDTNLDTVKSDVCAMESVSNRESTECFGAC